MYHNEDTGITREYSGAGRVSGSTFTLFYQGADLDEDGIPDRVTAVHEVTGDEMSGADQEQIGLWWATMTLTRQ